MQQIIEQTDKEKMAMYMKLSKEKLAEMLLQCNKLLDAKNKYMEQLSTWDSKYTDKRISQLHPDIQERAFKFVNACEEKLGIKIRVTDWLRTFAEQNELYTHGRTKPQRSIKTYAKGGESYHNYGLAIDVVEIKGNHALYGNSNWLKIGEMGETFGFEWGGRWMDREQKKLDMNKQLELIEEGEGFDKPHFQKSGLTIHELQELYKNKKGKWIKLPKK